MAIDSGLRDWNVFAVRVSVLIFVTGTMSAVRYFFLEIRRAYPQQVTFIVIVPCWTSLFIWHFERS